MVVMLPQVGTITYQSQRRRCGKTACRVCQTSPGPGPYWYAYSRGSDGKLHAHYIGKVLPPGVRLTARQQARWQALHPVPSL
jgi:hypothetical protein